jgi:hypothetical protein
MTEVLDMNFRNALLALFSLILLNGCATIIHGTTQDIGVSTDPSGAEVLVDGQERYKSPTKITMKRKDDHMVEVSLEGFQKETINIKSVVSGAVAGNILAGGLIGWGIDAASGGQYRLVPENIDVRLRPIATQAGKPTEEAKESIEEKLDQLKKLKDRGKINQEEYDKMRKEILSSPSKAKIATTSTQKKAEIPSHEPPKAVLPKIEDKTETE